MSEKAKATVKIPEVKKDILNSRKPQNNLSISFKSPVEQVLSLQRTAGNQAVQRFLKSGALQAKLMIGAPGDVYEQEADRVAQQVVSSAPMQRKCASCNKDEEEKKLIQRKVENTSAAASVPECFIQNLGAGQPLDPATRAFFEPRFGQDFSGVRVHTDGRAAEAAQVVGARAYTVGSDIAFSTNQYSPSSEKGIRLLAHELTHTIQQQKDGEGLRDETCADASAEQIGGAPPGIYAEKEQEKTANMMQMTLPTIELSWNDVAQQSMYQLPTPTLMQPFSQAQQSGKSGKQGEKPDTPSRFPLWSKGQFSIGLTLDFPESKMPEIEGASPRSFQEWMRRAKLLNKELSGKLPYQWEEIDKNKLVSIIWSIISTNLAPDVARDFQKKLTVTTYPGKPSYQLDMVIFSDFKGGGLSLTGRF